MWFSGAPAVSIVAVFHVVQSACSWHISSLYPNSYMDKTSLCCPPAAAYFLPPTKDEVYVRLSVSKIT